MSNTQNTAVSLVRGALLIGFAIVLAWLLLQFTDPSRGADSEPVAQSPQTTATTTTDDNDTITIQTNPSLSTVTISASTTTLADDDTATQTTESATQGPPSGKAPGETAILVLNGTGEAGAAGTLAATLEKSGYDVLTAANAATQVDQTWVYYNPSTISDADARVAAKAIGEAMAESEVKFEALNGQTLSSDSNEEGDADIIVVIG
ncbi:MAG: LytR C-terminal domain-containing protein [Actinobacteria bacterium]|nr:LytR C-terminal domain-containing protein [Actinomycetota bacterium]